jgi:shikimate kinase
MTAGPRGTPRPEDRNVVLVGLMGAGKSVVGRGVARKLGRPFVDTDAEIERRAGRSIPALFATEGEVPFRALERAAVAEVAARARQVVATGGGAVADPANRDALRRTGFVVYLAARPETLAARVGEGEGRPMLEGGDPVARIRELLARREPAYRQSDLVVDTDGLSVRQVVALVVDAARARGVR